MGELKVVVVALVEETLFEEPQKEEFKDFIKRIRAKYSELLKTNKVVLFVV